ncbi:hypothetical protein WME99_23635 [Sorangium sp. So ce136]|uniref:hypothetical protein n=1 Tax=Sorangium sp. So ce136 TaxID=3133284 RepID=UPI003EFCBF1C
MPPASPPSFELTSPRVGWRHEGLGRVFGGLALLAIGGPFLASVLLLMLADLLGDPDLRSHSFHTLTLVIPGALVALGLALVSVFLSTTPVSRRGPARVAAGAGGLRLAIGAAERWIPRAEVRSGLVLPEPRMRVELHLRRGQVLDVQVASEGEGARLLAGLGMGPAERRVAISLGGVHRELVAGCAGLPVLMTFWLVVLGGLFGHMGAALAMAWLVLTLVPTWLLRRAARPTRVVVGSDGVRVERPFSSAWLPYAELTEIRKDGDALLLVSQKSGTLVLETGEAVSDAVAVRIREAHQRVAGGAAPRGAEALERRGRDVAAWREDLRKLLATGDYRATGLIPEDAIRSLDDADAPRDRRIGAALFLRVAGYPEAQDRIRVAAGATADDALRAALEQAAEEELDDAALARALR